MSERFLKTTAVVLLLLVLIAGALYSSHRALMSIPHGWILDRLQSWWEIPEFVCGLAAYFVAAIGWAIITTHRPWWRVPVATLIALAAAGGCAYSAYRWFGAAKGYSPWEVPTIASAIVTGLIVRSWWTGALPYVFFIHVDHRCPTCGYDLRATPDRCPECGMVPREPNNQPLQRTGRASRSS